jgi:HAD superfamily hydrolase (TIGR01490 family)
MAQRTAYVVFCDVDETLIRHKSMLDFLSYYFAEPHGVRSTPVGDNCLAELITLQRQAAPRSELNRAYYRAYAGQAVTDVDEEAAHWYATRSSQPDFFITSTWQALAQHRHAGAELVLVSGSFAALLAPLARAVSAAAVLCTHMLTQAGKYTGQIDQPMIGEQKAAAVRALLATRPLVDPARCWAYGDDASDIPMLACVGQPVAVGCNPELRTYMAGRVPQP